MTLRLIAAVMKTRHLTLVHGNKIGKDRMQRRIDDFISDLHQETATVQNLDEILIAIHDYMAETDDPNLFMATIKIQEAIFYIGNFISMGGADALQD